MAVNNAINANTSGLVTFDGISTFGSDITTNHNLLVGAASNGITNVAPSATSGVPVISQGASADPTFGTAVVAGGGTGATSFTAYAVLCGGTTSTNALQSIASVGTNPQVLTSNDAGALPTFQAFTSGSGLQVASGTLTSAQIKTLGTPITIISAPGANKVIYVLAISAKFHYGGTNAFTGGGNLNIGYTSVTTLFTVPYTRVFFQSVIIGTASADTILYSPNGGYGNQPFFSPTVAIVENTPIVIGSDSGTNYAGNAAGNNTISYAVVYYVATY